jgi:hypothetical protein
MKTAARRKRADYTEETKPKTSKYAEKRRGGVKSNHARHSVSVPWCLHCQEEEKEKKNEGENS